VKLSMIKKLSLLLMVVVISACGNEGPSDDRVELDYKEFFNKNYKNLLLIEEFDIVSKDKLSDDRIDVKITTSLILNKQLEQEVLNYRGSSHISQHPLSYIYRRVKNIPPGHEETLIIHYKLDPQGSVWVIDSVN